MPRGRPRKHPTIKKLEGNRGKRPLDRLLIVPEGKPFPPDHLDDIAMGAFEHVVRSMPPGVFTAADNYVLSVFAAAWSIHRRALLELQEQGLVIIGSKGTEIPNPLVSVINRQAAILLQAAVRLGLDPVSRMSLTAPDYQAKSKFDGLLGRQPTGMNLDA